MSKVIYCIVVAAGLLAGCSTCAPAESPASSKKSVPVEVFAGVGIPEAFQWQGYIVRKEDLPEFLKQIGGSPIVVKGATGTVYGELVALRDELKSAGVADVSIGNK